MRAPVEIDRIERTVARAIATNPAGVNLLLIGGFRFRLLDGSARMSVDIDYHWSGDLQQKQEELLKLCRGKILGQVRRELGYEGSASRGTGPNAESPNAAFIDLRFWKGGFVMEIPVEVTRVICLDSPIVRTVGGTIHATPSDADVIESKVLAILNRLHLQHRDLVDLFLHADKLRPDSRGRLQRKIETLGLSQEAIQRRISDIETHAQYHSAGIGRVIGEQMDSVAMAQIQGGGGAPSVFSCALGVLKGLLQP